ncbi:Outer membrane porin protein 32 precursor,putative 3-hydroxyphenylpropionic acid porine [Candidatus Paraburkholderia kirkii UZHbot1]|uniref:Outer membrane porin protein 32,putative 3-hydroxyphenylpropionic acid porine n=1 Tax=Candidatus Paraburkholderia kirkii UZHbot1 TaxID=1055526 RepID=G4MBG5_9BURK|nr:Outer membrane porin protein 32 precursor,putative 3-hydroxyphenylpropionic acid porine [Candidatus Paraburkholderia kirkii UZHbot1]
MRTRAGILTSISCAIAAFCGTASAQSSVTLYGVVDNAFAYVDDQRGHSNVYMSQGNLQASKFGLLGAENLGGGTKAIFRLESGCNSLTGARSSAGVIFNRQAYAGLSNDRYGTLTLGRQYTPYFSMVGAHPGDVDALDTTLRFNNSVTYASPVIAGLAFSAQYGLGGVPGSIASGSNFSTALRYDYQPVSVAAGYVRLKDIATSPSLGTFAINSPVNNGYASAQSAQLIAATARYTYKDLMLGLNYSNVQYGPGPRSLFTDEAVFNSYGAIATYRFTPAVTVAAGYSYTRTSKSNGVSDPAQYHQISFEETYSLSARTTFYALQAHQRARGQSLIASGAGGTAIANAVAVVGDSQNATPFSGPSQFVAMVGIRHAF